MAEKKVANVIKLQIPAGAANPAPPVGPALGAAGVNIMQFCQAFNAETQDKKVDDLNATLAESDVPADGLLIQKGKKNFRRLFLA